MMALLMAQTWGHHEHKKGCVLHRKKQKAVNIGAWKGEGKFVSEKDKD